MLTWYGDMVREGRLKKKLILKEFSGLVSIGLTQLSRQERGLENPPYREGKLRLVATTLGIDPEYLVDVARITVGKLPDDIASDPRHLEQLPGIFGQLRAIRKPL